MILIFFRVDWACGAEKLLPELTRGDERRAELAFATAPLRDSELTEVKLIFVHIIYGANRASDLHVMETLDDAFQKGSSSDGKKIYCIERSRISLTSARLSIMLSLGNLGLDSPRAESSNLARRAFCSTESANFLFSMHESAMAV